MSTEIQKAEERAVEFIPYGCQDKIKLTVKLVQNIIAVPTKSGKTCSEKEAMKFVMMCQAKRLNPYEGDAFLIGYDGQDGVAKFSLITAHQAFLKRAELHPEYDGMKSGVIVLNEDSTTTDIEGDFHLPEQTVVGGWATVYFKTRKVPTMRRVRLARFNSGYAEWKKDPAGMICKCAEADALRSSFPTMLGGMYLKDEIDLPTNGREAHEVSSALTGALQTPSQPVSQPTPITDAEIVPPKNGNGSVKELADYVIAEGFTFDQFLKWGIESGNLENPDLGGFDQVPEAIAKRLLRAKAGLLKGLQVLREGQSV